MRSNYKKLGPFIREIDSRNNEGHQKNLLGVSTQKIFIESIANTVGTNWKKYKIVKRGQFTYVADTSRRGDKIGIAMLEDYSEALVSQAYTVFEVVDSEKLLPEYLMMWFRRPEFDRYARFKSHGSVREIFGWDEMRDVELPIPSLEQQQEIVNEYKAVQDRIKLNEELNQKLEDTAQTIYKHWFEDFEFPISKEYAKSIGKPELEGKPYKSSGGELVYNIDLDKKIPLVFKVKNLGDLVKIKRGASPRPINDFMAQKGMPWVKISDASNCLNKFLFSTKEFIKIEGVKKSRKVTPGTLILSNSASPGVPKIMTIEACVHDGWLIFDNYNKVSKLTMFQILIYHKKWILSSSNGSVFKNLKTDILKDYKIALPDYHLIQNLDEKLQVIDERLHYHGKILNRLSELSKILLSRLTIV